MGHQQTYPHYSDAPLPQKAGAFSAVGTSELANLDMPGSFVPAATSGQAPAARRAIPNKVLSRRRRWPIVLLCSLAILLALGAILFFLFSAKAEADIQEKYTNLLHTICASQTPAEAAGHRTQLNTFALQNPTVVDPDLETLLATCEAYEAAPDTEEKFINAVALFSQLKASPIERIAACADAMLLAVYSDYNQYLQAAGGLSGPSSQVVNPGAAIEMPLYVEGLAALGYSDGQEGFSITALNTSGKTITYLEVVLFCYDGAGNELTGANGYSWEWVYDYVTLQPGERHTPEVHNYWAFENCTNVAIGVPFINYVRFADGTEWGFSTPGMLIDEEFVAKLSLFKQSCDQQAHEYATASQTSAVATASTLPFAATMFPILNTHIFAAPAPAFSPGGWGHEFLQKTFLRLSFLP